MGGKGSWGMDETYIKVNGKWVYFDRAVDSNGDTVDFLLRAKRNACAVKAFLEKPCKLRVNPSLWLLIRVVATRLL